MGSETRRTYGPATTPIMNPNSNSSSTEQPDVHIHPTAGHVLTKYLLAKNLHLASHQVNLIKEFYRRPLTETEHREHLERVKFLEGDKKPQALYAGYTWQQRLMHEEQQRLEREQWRHQQQHVMFEAQQEQILQQRAVEQQTILRQDGVQQLQLQELQHQLQLQQQRLQQVKMSLQMISPSPNSNHTPTGYRSDAPDPRLPAFPDTVEGRSLHPLMTKAGDPVGHSNRRPLCPAPLYNDNGAYIGAPKSLASSRAPLSSELDTAVASVPQHYVDSENDCGHRRNPATTQSLWSPGVVNSTPASPTAEMRNDSKPALWGSIAGPCQPRPPLPISAPTLASEGHSQVSTTSAQTIHPTQEAETKDKAHNQIREPLEEKPRRTGVCLYESMTEAATPKQAGQNLMELAVNDTEPREIAAGTVKEKQEQVAEEGRWPAYMKLQGAITDEEMASSPQCKLLTIPPSAGEKYHDHAQHSELARRAVLRAAETENEYMGTVAKKTTVSHTQQQGKNKTLPSNGALQDSLKKSTLNAASSLTSNLPTAPKDTTKSMSLTVKDLLAFKAKNPAKNSRSLLSDASIDATVDSKSTSGKEATQDDSDTIAAKQTDYAKLEDAYNGMLASGLRLNPPDLPWRGLELPEPSFMQPRDVKKSSGPFWNTPICCPKGIPKAGEQRQLPSDEEVRKAVTEEQEKTAADEKQGAELISARTTPVERDAPIAEVGSPKLIAIWNALAEMEKSNRSRRYLAQAEQARTAKVENEQPSQSQDEVPKATTQEQNRVNAKAGINVTKAVKPQNITEVTASVNSYPADRRMHADAETKKADKARPDASKLFDRVTYSSRLNPSWYTPETQHVPFSADHRLSSAMNQNRSLEPLVQLRSTAPTLNPAVPNQPKAKEAKERTIENHSAHGQPFEWYEPLLPENGEDQKPEVKAKTVPAYQTSMLGSSKERSAKFKEEAERNAGRLRLASCNLEQEKSESYRTQQTNIKEHVATEESYLKWKAAKEARDKKDEARVEQERQERPEATEQQMLTPKQLALERHLKMMDAHAEAMEARREQEQRNHLPVTEQQETANQQYDGMQSQKKAALHALAQPSTPHPNELEDWACSTKFDFYPRPMLNRRVQQQLATNNIMAHNTSCGSFAYLQQLKKDEAKLQTPKGAIRPADSVCGGLAELEKAQQEPEQPEPEARDILRRIADANCAFRRSMQRIRDEAGLTPQQKVAQGKRVEQEYGLHRRQLAKSRQFPETPIAKMEEGERTGMKKGNKVEIKHGSGEAESTFEGDDFEKVSPVSQEDTVLVEEPASIGGALREYKENSEDVAAGMVERLQVAKAKEVEELAVVEGEDKIVFAKGEKEEVEGAVEDDEWETLTMDEGHGSNGGCYRYWW